jgi:hypothetical protein
MTVRTINTVTNTITGYLQGALGSMLEYMGTSSDPCARIKRLWNPASVSDQDTAGPGGMMSLVFLGMSVLMDLGAGIGLPNISGFRPMEGGGIERGAPYFDFNTLVKKTGMTNPLGTAIASLPAATDLTDEISALYEPTFTCSRSHGTSFSKLNVPSSYSPATKA